MKNRICIIAEAGVNHNGSVDLAKKLIDVAVDAGTDIIKFQTFQSEKLATDSAACATYQQDQTKSRSQQAMLKKLELPNSAFIELKAYCDSKSIEFLSTPFDEESAQFLAEEIGMKRFKIPSGEITNLPFLDFVGKYKKPVILSTGMSDLDEVEAAVRLLNAYLTAGQLALLHCTSSYPCPYSEVNLKALETLKEKFGLPVGYSDHTLGIEVSIGAAALGASIIEKHITLDRNLPGPDQKTSLEPSEFKTMVESIRHIEQALGSSEKKPTSSELEMRNFVRKSLVASKSLFSGSVIKREDLAAKRPGTGISPADLKKVVGSKLIMNKNQNELIRWTDLER